MTGEEQIAADKAEREKFEMLLPSLQEAYKSYLCVLVDMAHTSAGGPPRAYVVRAARDLANKFADRQRTVGEMVQMWTIAYKAKVQSVLWFHFDRKLELAIKAGKADKIENTSAILAELKKLIEGRKFEAHNS